MVDNLVEKVNECPAKFGSLSIVCVQLGRQKLSVIWSTRVSAVQGLLKYWSEWKDSQDFQKLNCMSVISRVQLLRGVRKVGFHCITKCTLPPIYGWMSTYFNNKISTSSNVTTFLKFMLLQSYSWTTFKVLWGICLDHYIIGAYPHPELLLFWWLVFFLMQVQDHLSCLLATKTSWEWSRWRIYWQMKMLASFPGHSQILSRRCGETPQLRDKIPSFLHSCEIKSRSGLGTRLWKCITTI